MTKDKSSPGGVQFMSDLHLEASEVYATFDFPVTAPYLLLSGDVGSLADYEEYMGFIKRQTERYAGVLLVLGNHEFHGLDYGTTLDKAKELEAEPSLEGRLHVLHRRRFDVPGTNVSILGCTLWTTIPGRQRRQLWVGSRIFNTSKVGISRCITQPTPRTWCG
ncbi:hsp90 co-chaperone cdc37 [Colletotrichum tofieldiae]|nr:hsp90 co-chaperone cdc37 [Colletotrichum tofieldiae]